uniref:RNase H type-1 domain-containing protein n=1 Tax=Oryza punctata TaxID=4537 RepID=A0A0E0L6Y4_ORYPU
MDTSGGGLLQDSGTGGWGFAVRNSSGFVLEAGAGFISRASSALQAEALAGQRSLMRVAQLGMTRIIVEVDASNLGKALNSQELDRKFVTKWLIV